MLNIDDPKSEYIFQASGFLDRIKYGCRSYIIQDFEDRKLTFLKMKDECEALTVFSATHFPEEINKISALTKSIVTAINKFEKINVVTEKDHCKICDTPLIISSYLTMCTNCNAEIYTLLSELEIATGADFI